MNPHSPQFEQAWRDLVAERNDALRAGADHSGQPLILFPGAFNPLHQGHLAIAQLASRVLNTDTHFEISIRNVDKADLALEDARARLARFAQTAAVWITRAPTFVEKARLFPGVTFLVGADTIQRIGNAKYYGGDEAVMGAAITEIAQRNCRFLVFGRLIEEKFAVLSELRLPTGLEKLCHEIGEDEFRFDISSTELRG